MCVCVCARYVGEAGIHMFLPKKCFFPCGTKIVVTRHFGMRICDAHCCRPFIFSICLSAPASAITRFSWHVCMESVCEHGALHGITNSLDHELNASHFFVWYGPQFGCSNEIKAVKALGLGHGWFKSRSEKRGG